MLFLARSIVTINREVNEGYGQTGKEQQKIETQQEAESQSQNDKT